MLQIISKVGQNMQKGMYCYTITSFEVFIVVIVKIAVFWVMTPCGFIGRNIMPVFKVEFYRFRNGLGYIGNYSYPPLLGLMTDHLICNLPA
jgi:hypothetical protein